jgi:hypothetical protein
MNVLDYINKLQSVRNRLQDETEKIIYKNENKIIQLNTKQIDDFIGFDGKELKNTDSKYRGIYTLSTQLINPLKVAGNPYNFNDTGNFFSGFYIEVSNDLTKVIIDSTGTGTGQKADFFKGYNNIFGLTNQNQYILNYEIILPELQKFIKENLK